MKDSLLSLKPIQKFISKVGQKVKEYFGQDNSCIVCLEDDGVFYGKGLWEWISKTKKNVNLIITDREGKNLKEEAIKGRKILIVDNDIITGKTYRKIMDLMEEKKEKLKIKDIKFAVVCDRIGLADFSVESYPSPIDWSLENLDSIDFKILSVLAKDGRKSFVDIAKITGLTSVGVKKRVERLMKNDILKIKGLLNIEKLYSLSANIRIEANEKTVERLVKKFKKSPFVYDLIRTSERFNLILSIVIPDLKRLSCFVEENIRNEKGVKEIEVSVGEIPIKPKLIELPLSQKEIKNLIFWGEL